MHVGEVIHLNLFDLRGEAVQRLQSVSAYKIRKETAQKSDRRGDIPVGRAKVSLCSVNNDCCFLAEVR